MDTTNERLVFQDQEVVVLAAASTDTDVFRSVLTIRSHDPRGRCHFPFDEYSTHYCMYGESGPIGAITATRRTDGVLDCDECYAACLLEHFHNVVFSSCKLRILRSGRLGFHGLRAILRSVWRDQLVRGARLDVMNAERRMQTFYERVGYVAIRGSEFVHPLLGTDSIAMLLPADPTRRSFCQEEFRDLDDPLAIDDVRAVIPLCE